MGIGFGQAGIARRIPSILSDVVMLSLFGGPIAKTQSPASKLISKRASVQCPVIDVVANELGVLILRGSELDFP